LARGATEQLGEAIWSPGHRRSDRVTTVTSADRPL
jgi:hypothetical protein